MKLAVGDLAPDFELSGVDGRTGQEGSWRLSQLRGRPVVLVFYPADNSPVCTAQLEDYTREVGTFEQVEAAILAISPQSPESHRGFAQRSGGFGFPLLSDEDKAVAESYGNLGLFDLYRRSTFVVDAEGGVRWIHRSVGPGLRYRPVDDLVAAVEAAT